jgi:hypothetical protein
LSHHFCLPIVGYYFCICSHSMTVGRNPLDEGSAMTTHYTHMRRTSIPPAVSKPAIPTSERPQTHATKGAPPGIGPFFLRYI